MAIIAHAPHPNQPPPLASHPVVSTSTLPLAAQLLIAQAVAQLGSADWKAVEYKIEHSKEWPEGEAGRLTSQGYHEAFKGLMHERGLDSSACSQPLSRPSRKLVHSLYSTLLSNLRADILTNLSEEARLNSELASIRAAAQQQQQQQPTSSSAAPSSAPIPGSSDSKKRSRSREGKGRGSAPASAAAAEQQQEGEDAEMTSPSAAAAADGGEESKKPSSGGRRKSSRKVVSSVYVDEDSHDEDDSIAPPSASATPAPSAVEGTPAPAVKAEEEDDSVPPGEGEGEEEEGEGEEEGDEEEEEGDEEEVTTRKSTRARKGSRKSRTAAATAAKKAQQARKRKQSEPLSTIGEDSVLGESERDGETVADTPPPQAEASAPPSASSKRGGGRKRVKTEELGEEDKDAKLALQRRKSAYTRLITQLQSERYSHFFETRVTRSIAPKYNIAVLRPTCLKDILKKIKAGDVRDETELMREVGLLCANAMQFNGDEGEESVGHCARLMWERFERLVEEYMSTELAAGDL
ncbi:hypothetical protein JCM11251_006934 [Rhodosporidiobolus azoricus]